MTQLPVAKRPGPGRPPAQRTPDLRYTATEKQIAIEYVISLGGDVIAAQEALQSDPDWNRADIPAVQTIKSWCMRDGQAKLAIDVFNSYGVREKLMDATSKVLTALQREMQHADRPTESKEAQGYADRADKLAAAASKLVDKWHLLVRGNLPSQGQLTIPRIGERQNVDGNDTAAGDQVKPLVTGGTNINLFSRREVLVLAGDLRRIGANAILEAANVIDQDTGAEEDQASTTTAGVDRPTGGKRTTA